MTLSISPTTTSVCTNQDATFTVTPSGGTAPYTYSWTYSVPSGPVIGAGTGNPKTFNFPTANTYTIVCTVTDALGCQVSIFATMTVTNCTSCICTPSLTLAGCILTGSFAGDGCGSFTYQLQYSATGTGWSVVTSGLASTGGSFTHTPTANGFYRLIIAATGGSGCSTQVAPDVSVTCVTSCNCTAGVLSYSSSLCQLSWTNPCSGAGYVASLERFNGTTWVYVTQTTPFSPTQDGQYRIKYQKGGCPDVFSNIVVVELLLDCPTLQGDLCGDGVDYYLPEQAFALHRHNFFIPGSPNNTSFTGTDFCGNNTTSSNWTIVWGDGTANNTGTGYNIVNHTYAVNGTYKHEYDLNTSLGLCESDSYVYPNGNPNVNFSVLFPYCGDGGYPVYFSRDCGNVKIWINFGLTHANPPTYTNHSVNINGINYTVPITFTTANDWDITNICGTPITIPLSTLNNNIIPITVTTTINTNQVLRSKGYFRISCN
jgi:hypothetical protein